ncbi:MAG TPA: POTRA domain-containing protein [Kofleriaceae bacterium]|nr:POTRA domain-containing protein [Kofleriaceae bacterium]
MTRAAALAVLALAATAHAESPAGLPQVEIVGNRDVSTEALRAAATAVLHGFSRPRSDDAIARASLAVSAYYWDHGYIAAKVTTMEYVPARDTVRITIADEGEVFALGQITIDGDLAGFDPASLAIRPGMVFSRSMIARDRQALTEHYLDQGYAYANVLPLTKVDRSARTVAITFQIDRGKPARFGAIALVGAHREPEAWLRGELTVATGQPYSFAALEQSRRQLEALGVAVSITQNRGATDDAVDVTFEVGER